MATELKVGLIGLDTSHSVEFPKRMQAPECAPENKVEGLRAVTCMAFTTPFQDEKGIATRTKQLEAWGIKVTKSFDEAVAGVDALLIEINDPSLHLEYFRKCADLGKNIFLDKPLADNYANGREIFDIAKKKNVKVMSASSLRFAPALTQAMAVVNLPDYGYFYGPLGLAPAGSSLVWYGVHAFEMLVRAMGRGAKSCRSVKHSNGVVVTVEYPNKRSAIVDLQEGCWAYGGTLRGKEKGNASYVVDGNRIYTDLVNEIAGFLKTGKSPVPFEDTLEVMALLDTAERSLQAGKEASVPQEK